MALEPAPPAGHTSGQKIAAFCVGCLVLAGLFVSAVFNWVPANLVDPIIRLCIAVAGAGFASFLAGVFDWHLPTGLKVTGTIGLFVFLLLWNPAEKAPLYFNKNFESCKNNVLDGNSNAALDYCKKAVSELPEFGEPAFWLGKAQYGVGRIEARSPRSRRRSS